ncbi:MAG: glycoside hydrolase family 32 protein [Peptostreptococcaceae bacterium]
MQATNKMYLNKYRTIDSAKENELEGIREKVIEDKEYRPSYHIYPKTGLLNDPNGLVFDGEKYHIFYQWYPFDSIHGMKHWQHLTTKDFLKFKEEKTIVPKETFETHGCYSGGGVVIGDSIYCFYTGNTRQNEDYKRVSYQNIAVIDKNTSEISSKYCIATTPNGFTEQFRDPKPWIQNEEIKFICAAQRKNETGTAAIFTYDDKNKTSKYIGELEVENVNNEDVFMWECPDLFSIDNNDVFLWCPQGIKPINNRFQNIYSSTYAIGTLKGNKFNTHNWDEIDRGFDFYAPQTIMHTSNDEIILIGWIGLPGSEYPADTNKWQGALSLPRVLSVVNHKLYQKPHRNIYKLIDESKKEMLTSGLTEIKNTIVRSYLKADIENKEFEINLFTRDDSKLSLIYKKGCFILDRSNTLQTKFMKQYGDYRRIEINQLDNIEIFIDNSIIEIYINNGEYVLTSRFFIENKNKLVEIQGDINLIMYEMKGIKLWEE